MKAVQMEASFVTKVTSLSSDGEGIGFKDDRRVYIDGALPEEEVRFSLRRRRRRKVETDLIEVITPSPHRVSPPCEYFGTCGGCSLQHMSHAGQLQIKEDNLRKHLVEAGDIQPSQWQAPIIGPLWHYRRKARLSAKLVPKKGGILIGFRERHHKYVTGLKSCKTLDERIADILPDLHTLVDGLSCVHRIPQIEVAVGDNETALVFRHLEPFTSEDESRLCEFGQQHQLQIWLQPKGPDSVHRLWPEQEQELEQEQVPSLCYQLPEHDITINFGPADFTQVNIEVNRQMVSQALKFLDPQSDDAIVDLFCGLGNFTLPIARRAGRVLGLEGDENLIAAARYNAKCNAIDNTDFQVADLYDETASVPWEGFRFNKLMLDPPRSGAMPILKRLPRPLPERIVYVSCNSQTLAQDSEYLVRTLGYGLTHAGIVDMFPHTNHVEAMAVFDYQG